MPLLENMTSKERRALCLRGSGGGTLKNCFPPYNTHGVTCKRRCELLPLLQKKRHHSLSDILFSIHSGTTLHMYLFPAKSRESPKKCMYAYTILVWPFMLHNSSRVEASNSQITQHSLCTTKTQFL